MEIQVTSLVPGRIVALFVGILMAISACAIIQSPTLQSSSSPSLSFLIFAAQSSPSPTVDGYCVGTSNALNNNACKLSTTNSPDLIIAEAGTGSSSSTITSISDQTGLTWKLYAHYALSGSSAKSLFVYYAFASLPLTSDNVSVKYSTSGRNGLLVMAVNNYNPATPFDPASTPATSSSTGSMTAQVTPVNIVNSNELLLGLFDIASTPVITAGSGFTGLPHSGTPSVYAEWEQLSSAGSGLTVGATISSSQAYLGTAFGINPAPATTSTSQTITTTTTISSTFTTTTSSLTSTSTTTSISSSTFTSTSLTVSASSTGNPCFVNGYNSDIPVINAIYWECGATLQGSQSIKQNIFRSSELFGAFTLTLNASQRITLTVMEDGIVVFSQSGTNITYSGTANQDESMYVSVSNSETSLTTYMLGIDWTGV